MEMPVSHDSDLACSSAALILCPRILALTWNNVVNKNKTKACEEDLRYECASPHDQHRILCSACTVRELPLIVHLWAVHKRHKQSLIVNVQASSTAARLNAISGSSGERDAAILGGKACQFWLRV